MVGSSGTNRKYMTSSDIREAFLRYFESKGHLRLASASLVPVNDPSLLLINAGMAPLKRYFEGTEAPPAPRCCSSQKCVRTIDIDEVGRTNRHNTFFEMLGNFSFGDYFKKDAIAYCWEFMTSAEWMGLPPERLYSTVHESDTEAYGYWEKVWLDAQSASGGDETLAPSKRIYHLGDKHNFWAAGATGPCGYDSEVYFDLAPDTDEVKSGSPQLHTREWFEFWEERGRFIEVWNNVFMEFNRDEAGVKTPLPKKNVDTGMGLERLVMVKQALDRGENWQCVFLTDLFDHLTSAICDKLIINQTHTEFRTRINRYDFSGMFEPVVTVADHIRASVFLLADGVTPTNEGRGYVLRKLIRRVVQYGFILSHGKCGKFVVPIAEQVIVRMSGAFPELKRDSDKIKKNIAHEESQFLTLLERNYDGIYTAIERAKTDEKPLGGEVAFFYHDSQGFPIDVTRDLCAQFGVELDEVEYERLMKEQRERARSAAKFDTEFGTDEMLQKGEFAGYDTLSIDDVKVLAVREVADKKGDNEASQAGNDSKYTGIRSYIVVTDRTPFYAEGGGQPGDQGTLEIDGAEFEIVDSKESGQHVVIARNGASVDKFAKLVVAGANVKLTVDNARRCAIARAHTATHLLHKALKTVLGGHVQQAGSQLYEDSFRFDYSHTQAMTADEIAEIERLVRGYIVSAHPVTTATMPLADAKTLGVTALFDEKYGQTVRVVTVGTPDGAITFDGYPYERSEVVSRELCGGSHVSRSSDIGGFAIVREESVSAGMRRITAVTGDEVWKVVAEESGFARRMRVKYNTAFDDIERHIEHIESDLKLTREKLLRAERDRIIAKWMDEAQAVHSTVVRESDAAAGGTPVEIVAMAVEGVGRESLKFLADRISEAYPDAVILLGENIDGKAAFVCKVPQARVSRGIKAGDIVKEAAQACGGGGGGRPDFAEAGGKDGGKVADGIEAGRKAIRG